MICWMVISESKSIFKKSTVLFKEHVERYGPFFWLFYWCSRVKILVCKKLLQLWNLFVYRKDFAIWRIDGNLPSENVRFIKSVRGSLRGYLNCLNRLFGMLKEPVILLFLICSYRTALPPCLLDRNKMCLQLVSVSNLDISYVSSPYYSLFVLAYQRKNCWF